jgi:hypothetical protein
MQLKACQKRELLSLSQVTSPLQNVVNRWAIIGRPSGTKTFPDKATKAKACRYRLACSKILRRPAGIYNEAISRLGRIVQHTLLTWPWASKLPSQKNSKP